MSDSNSWRGTRRTFLGATAATLCAPLLPPSSARADGERLKVACIGLGGRMDSLLKEIVGLQQNVVALCDVDANRIQETHRSVGDAISKAVEYRDYRKLLETETSLDAVIIATPDHWHVPICSAVMHAGKHVYCEKPLAHTVSEARHLRDLTRRSKVVTQTGNQGSASANLRRCVEVIQAGVLGQIKDIHIWHPAHSWPSGVDRPAGEDPIPAGFDWDFWLGTSPVRPYKTGIYHPAAWRGWYDFGNGSIGDFCCHAFNLPVRALNLEYPTRIEVSGANLGKESFPTSCTLRFHFSERGAFAPLTIFFYTGGDLPPAEVTKDLASSVGKVPELGCLMLGEMGTISAGLWNDEGRMKMNGEPEFRSVQEHDAAKAIAQTLPRSPGHMREWVDACMGGPPVYSSFEIGGHITEIGLAGSVALRLGRAIDWDGKAMKVRGEPEGARLVRPEYRKEWRSVT